MIAETVSWKSIIVLSTPTPPPREVPLPLHTPETPASAKKGAEGDRPTGSGLVLSLAAPADAFTYAAAMADFGHEARSCVVCGGYHRVDSGCPHAPGGRCRPFAPMTGPGCRSAARERDLGPNLHAKLGRYTVICHNLP